MSSFALRQQGLLDRLTDIAKFGNSATFNHQATTYDRDTGKTANDGALVTLATTVGGPVGVNPRLINGDTIQETDQTIIVEASRLTFTISIDTTKVTIDGRVYAITSITPSRANDVTIAYTLVIR